MNYMHLKFKIKSIRNGNKLSIEKNIAIREGSELNNCGAVIKYLNRSYICK